MPTSINTADIVIGFDPGLAITGYGVISGERVLEYGVCRTPAHTPTSDRLASLYTQVTELLNKYKAVVVGCEELFFARNVSTAFDVGEARGIILLAIVQHHLPLVELTPLQVKQSLTGYGKADKKQIQFMVKTVLHLTDTPQPDDAADALAIALATQTYAKTTRIIAN